LDYLEIVTLHNLSYVAH